MDKIDVQVVGESIFMTYPGEGECDPDDQIRYKIIVGADRKWAVYSKKRPFGKTKFKLLYKTNTENITFNQFIDDFEKNA